MDAKVRTKGEGVVPEFWPLFGTWPLDGRTAILPACGVPKALPQRAAALQGVGNAAGLTFWQSTAVGIPFDGVEMLFAAAKPQSGRHGTTKTRFRKK